MKKMYEKPQVTRIELRIEEAVLTACKTIGSPHNAAYTVGFSGCGTVFGPNWKQCRIDGS